MRRLRKTALLALVADLALALLLTASAGFGSIRQGGGDERTGLIVRAQPGQERRAEAAVRDLGGRVELRLPAADGFVAVLPASAERALEASPAVRSVVRDHRLAL